MENLPVEMYQEVFSYLDKDSLKTSKQVCKKWLSSICGSTALMKNTKLRVTNFKAQKKFIQDWGKTFKEVLIKSKKLGDE
jgi:hypothetical protein